MIDREKVTTFWYSFATQYEHQKAHFIAFKSPLLGASFDILEASTCGVCRLRRKDLKMMIFANMLLYVYLFFFLQSRPEYYTQEKWRRGPGWFRKKEKGECGGCM
jgi:hypothetical protein